MRVFDELIQNRDRNAGNLLWTADWKMWMIDHTRAFRLGKELLKPQQLERVERTLFEKMRELNETKLADAMGKSMTKAEIDALLARRDAIVKLFDDRIAQRGEAAVVYTLAPVTAAP
jgi:DNA phosphorothioation-dependent restriction protein DptG